MLRFGDQHAAEFFDFGFTRRRADEHAVAARAVGFFHHQFVQICQCVFKFVRLAALVGRDVVQNRFFGQVKTNHVGDERVNRFVIRHARANCVGQCDVTGAVAIEQTRHAERGIRAKRQRIEKIVVNPTVNHIDAFRTVGRAHIHMQIIDE